MEIKEYKIYKASKKTAKENNLILTDGVYSNVKRLFDFSLLDNINISDREKEVIKKDAVEHIGVSSNISMYGESFDKFTACNGITRYCVQSVFSENGKNLYNIFMLLKVKHFSKERKNIYENYVVKIYEASANYAESINFIEIK